MRRIGLLLAAAGTALADPVPPRGEDPAARTSPGPATARSPDIVVTATPLPAEAGQCGQALSCLGADDIARWRGLSVPELLEFATPVEISERGAGGVQADLSIRGSTFQQVLVTLDGLPLADPQTGHHNLDLPLPLSAVEQITVIPGPGSALFGPTAFAGVVDLTPRRPAASGFRLRSAVGRFETRRAEATADLVRNRVAATVAGSCERSDGFREGTDYRIWSVWSSAFVDLDPGGLRLSVGHADKDFGARDFYASYPSRERTRISLLDIAPQFDLAPGWRLKAVMRYRGHEDEFILMEDNPSFYRNEHQTRSFTGRAILIGPDTALGTTAFGVERTHAALDSSSLGDRDASAGAGFVHHRLPATAYTAHLGLRADRERGRKTEVCPSLSIAAPLADALVWRAALGRGIRPPSFTELYYRDPANLGDPDLRPEVAWGGETGVDLGFRCGTRASLTCFRRETRELIDWVRSSPDEPWQAANIGGATFQGGEASLAGSSISLRWEIAYRYTDTDAEVAGVESKYALNAARHDLRLSLGLPERRGCSAAITVRYRDVPTLDNYCLAAARVARRIGRLTVFAGGANLLDKDYEEIPGVPTAGRYVELGLECDL